MEIAKYFARVHTELSYAVWIAVFPYRQVNVLFLRLSRISYVICFSYVIFIVVISCSMYYVDNLILETTGNDMCSYV